MQNCEKDVADLTMVVFIFILFSQKKCKENKS